MHLLILPMTEVIMNLSNHRIPSTTEHIIKVTNESTNTSPNTIFLTSSPKPERSELGSKKRRRADKTIKVQEKRKKCVSFQELFQISIVT